MKHGSLRDIQLDDIEDFELTDAAMTHMGMTDADKLAIYTIIAGVLHLGNVSFDDRHDDSTGLNQQRSIFSSRLVAYWPAPIHAVAHC